MPIIALIVGIMLIVVGINNKMPELTALLKEDFNPSSNVAPFQIWILAIFVAGSLGYVKELRPIANAFLTLIVISLILSNGGFFAKFSDAVKGN